MSDFLTMSLAILVIVDTSFSPIFREKEESKFLSESESKNRLNETLNAEKVENYAIRGRKDKITLYKVQT